MCVRGRRLHGHAFCVPARPVAAPHLTSGSRKPHFPSSPKQSVTWDLYKFSYHAARPHTLMSIRLTSQQQRHRIR